MIAAFVNRSPWAALIVALILSPAGGMFYLGRGRVGIVYAVAGGLAIAMAYILAHLGVRQIPAQDLSTLLAVAVTAVGMIHCYVTAKRQNGNISQAWFARWYAVIGLVVVAPIVAGLIIRSFFWETFNIPAASMLPTLEVGDHLIVEKYAYGYSRHSLPFSAPLISGRIFSREPKRGDIVVFKSTLEGNTPYVKRIGGLPGEKIHFENGVLHIDDKPVDQQHTGESSTADLMGHAATFWKVRETLPNGVSYSVLVTEVTGSLDNTDAVEVPADHYFVLGDNRNNSFDSRVPAFGFVPKESLIGRVETVFWNKHSQKLMWLSPE